MVSLWVSEIKLETQRERERERERERVCSWVWKYECIFCWAMSVFILIKNIVIYPSLSGRIKAESVSPSPFPTLSRRDQNRGGGLYLYYSKITASWDFFVPYFTPIFLHLFLIPALPGQQTKATQFTLTQSKWQVCPQTPPPPATFYHYGILIYFILLDVRSFFSFPVSYYLWLNIHILEWVFLAILLTRQGYGMGRVRIGGDTLHWGISLY